MNLTGVGLVIALVGGLVTYIVGGVLFGWTPYHSLIIPAISVDKQLVAKLSISDANFATILTNILWQGALVAPMEELMKMAGYLALYHKWQNEAAAVITTVLTWAASTPSSRASTGG